MKEPSPKAKKRPRQFTAIQEKTATIKEINLRRVIESLQKKSTPKKHRLLLEYGTKAERVLNECLLPSFERLSVHAPLYHFSCGTSTLLYQLRRALLKRNWPYFLIIFHELVQSNQINRRSLIYVIRSSLIILLNYSKDVELVREFISFCLGIKDEEKVQDFLRSIFIMPDRLKLGVILENIKSRNA